MRSRWWSFVLVPFALANPSCAEDGKACRVDASNYDQTCVVADDCAIVTDGNMCSDCRCARAVINRNERGAFEREVATIDPPPNECDCAAFIDVECVAGQCRGID